MGVCGLEGNEEAVVKLDLARRALMRPYVWMDGSRRSGRVTTRLSVWDVCSRTSTTVIRVLGCRLYLCFVHVYSVC